jgi:hypothetical protein
MIDPVNPTLEEIEAWAHRGGAMYPMQDWDLMVAVVENVGPVLVRLAADRSCAQREAIMNFLYVHAGQMVRENGPEGLAALRRTIDLAMASASSDLQSWSKRATDALQGRGPNPAARGPGPDYDYWFLSGWRKASSPK